MFVSFVALGILLKSSFGKGRVDRFAEIHLERQSHTDRIIPLNAVWLNLGTFSLIVCNVKGSIYLITKHEMF